MILAVVDKISMSTMMVNANMQGKKNAVLNTAFIFFERTTLDDIHGLHEGKTDKGDDHGQVLPMYIDRKQKGCG